MESELVAQWEQFVKLRKLSQQGATEKKKEKQLYASSLPTSIFLQMIEAPIEKGKLALSSKEGANLGLPTWHSKLLHT